MDLAIIADAFVVTVVGGLGSIPGAFLAAALIGVTKAFCIALGDVDVFGVTLAFPKLTLVVEFVIMAIVLALKPARPARQAATGRRHDPAAGATRAGAPAGTPHRLGGAGRAGARRAAPVHR